MTQYCTVCLTAVAAEQCRQ